MIFLLLIFVSLSGGLNYHFALSTKIKDCKLVILISVYIGDNWHVCRSLYNGKQNLFAFKISAIELDLINYHDHLNTWTLSTLLSLKYSAKL